MQDRFSMQSRGLGAVFSDSYVILAFALSLVIVALAFRWGLTGIVLITAIIAGWRTAWSP